MYLALALFGAVVFGLIAHGHVALDGQETTQTDVPSRPYNTVWAGAVARIPRVEYGTSAPHGRMA